MYPEINKFSGKFRAIYTEYSGDTPQNESWEDFEHFLFEIWSDGYEQALIDCNKMEDTDDGILDNESTQKRNRNKRQEKYSLPKHQDRTV